MAQDLTLELCDPTATISAEVCGIQEQSQVNPDEGGPDRASVAAMGMEQRCGMGNWCLSPLTIIDPALEFGYCQYH